ncbi:MAG: hypothetical protein AAFQ01_05370 [Bacteroidota bacterium]
MKSISILFLLAVICLTPACSNDDDDAMMVCTQSDWVGTYTGTINCEGSDAEDVTVTITASGSENIDISYQTATVSTTFFDPFSINNCSVSRTATSGGITATVEASLNGNTLTLEEMFSGTTAFPNCTLTCTRN